MFDFKVEYIPTSQYKQKWYLQKVDGLKLAKEIEAMLIEYDQKGYDLITMESITSGNPSTHTSQTDGMMLVFRKRKD
jgi:hypothetical protein